jgi:hypothetical protein
MINTDTAGKRVALVSTDDPYTKLRPGSEGTVRSERFDGTYNMVSVNWDDGSSLMLVEGVDRFRFLD